MAVEWRVLVLEGFGRYRGRAEVKFTGGINTIVAPNESGKSTLVAGLGAVLYGLSTSASREGFGTGRFANWEGAPQFRGMVEFSVGSDLYGVRRQFDSNRISLEKKAAGACAWETVVTGEHNPSARKRNELYERTITDVLGISSRELFEHTFCIVQPLPEVTGLDSSVQQLLSGAGADVDEALGMLFAQLREITRYNLNFGVGSANARQDKELDLVERRVAEAERLIREQGQALDQLPVRQAELRAAEEKKQRVDKELEQKRALAVALSEWRSARSSYEAAIRQKSIYEQALEQLRRLYAEAEATKRELEAKYSECASLPADTPDKLRELVAVESSISERSREIECLAAEIEDLREQVGRSEEQLANALMQGWARLGPGAAVVLAKAKAQAERFLSLWRKLQDTRQEVLEIRHRLQAELAVFESLSPEALDALAQYDVLTVKLTNQAASARTARVEAEERRRQFDAEERMVKDEFADVEGLGEEFVGAAQRKIGLLEERYRLEASFGQEKPSTARVPGSRLLPVMLSAIAAFVLIWVFWGRNAGAGAGLVASAAGALLTGIIAWTLVSSSRRNHVPNELMSRLQAVKSEVTSVDSQLGQYADLDQAALAHVLARVLQRRQALSHLEKIRTELPDEATLSQLRSNESAATSALDSFRALVAPVEASFESPGDAYRLWRRLRDSLELQEAQLRETITSLLGESTQHLSEYMLHPQRVEDVPVPSGDQFDALNLLASVVGQKLSSLGDLARWLGSIDHPWWQETERQIGEYEAMRERLARQRDQAVAALTEREQRLAALEQARTNLARKADSLRDAVKAILAAVGGKAADAVDRWQSYQALVKKSEGIGREVSGVLQGLNVETEEALRDRLNDTAARVLKALGTWEELVKAHPALPPAELDYDHEAIARRQRELEAEIARLQDESNQVAQEVSRLNKHVATLEASLSANIAQVEEQLAQDRQIAYALRLKARSLALAHKELQEAKKSFQSKFRTLLAERATERFAELSGVGERRVQFDEDFRLRLDFDGIPVSLAQLSQGARDQLYIALRLAIADLLAGGVTLPFIFDDPFLTFDQERTERVRITLNEIAKSRQVIVLSHRPEIALWGQQATIVMT